MADAQAWSEGFQLGSERAHEHRAHKQALSDEEHEAHITDLFDQRRAILSNPTLADTEKAIKLQDVAAKLREAYHPDKHPGALQKFGHMITDNMRITDPMKRAKKEGDQKAARSAGDEKTAQGWMSEAPVSPEQQAAIEARSQAAGQKIKDDAREKQLNDWFDRNAVDKSPEARQRFLENAMGFSAKGTYGKPITYLLPDGTKILARNAPGGVIEDLEGNAVDIPPDALIAPPPAKPGTSEFNERAAAYAKMHNIKFEDLTNADFNYIDQQIKLAKLSGNQTISNTLKQNIYGQWVPVQETNTRIPYLGQFIPDPRGNPATPPPSVSGSGLPGVKPNAPGVIKKPVGAVGSSTKVGPPVLQGRTPEYDSAKKDLDIAVGLAAAAHAAEKADPSVKAGLQRQIAGRLQNTLEKRFNLQAMDNLISHYGIANNFETWLSRAETGALPDAVFKELVGMADNNIVEKKAALANAMPPPLNGAGASQTQTSTGKPEKATHTIDWIDPQTKITHTYWLDSEGNNLGEKK